MAARSEDGACSTGGRASRDLPLDDGSGAGTQRRSAPKPAATKGAEDTKKTTKLEQAGAKIDRSGEGTVPEKRGRR